ncbi:branched chain amino acid ABC transporter substrate-binding protein [Spirochaetia bacterium]|nr:branched chain amino acid ABC transporter substrate-binding protein [Spirochaetia bacterium]
MKQIGTRLGAVLLILAALAACKAKEDAFYVAFAEPLTGDLAQYGEYAYNGIMIKIDEVNAAGGINGRKIIVEQFDDKGEAKEAANLAQRLSDDKKYICVFGGYNSPCALAGAPIYERNKMVQFAPTAGHMDLPNYEYTFVQALGASLEFQLFSKIAVQQLQGKKIALIYINNDNGLEVLQALTKWVPEYGSELVISDTYNEGQVRDFTAMLTRIRNANPDLICVHSSYGDAAAMLIQAKQVGLGDTRFMFATPMYSNDFVKAAGAAAEGAYVVATFSALDPNPAIQKFSNAFKERTGGKEPNQFCQQPYEQAGMLVKALQEGATDRESLYRILMSWKRWEGETYSANLVNRRPQRDTLTLLVVKNGTWAYAD